MQGLWQLKHFFVFGGDVDMLRNYSIMAFLLSLVMMSTFQYLLIFVKVKRLCEEQISKK